MYQIHCSSHLAEDGVSVLLCGWTFRVPQARFAGCEQHHGASLQYLSGRRHLRASPLVFQIVLRKETRRLINTPAAASFGKASLTKRPVFPLCSNEDSTRVTAMQ